MSSKTVLFADTMTCRMKHRKKAHPQKTIFRPFALLRWLYLCSILFFAQAVVPAQQSRLSTEICAISSYIASDGFLAERKAGTDIESIDLIFRHAVQVCGGDTSEALVAAMFAAVPFNVVHTETPFLHVKLDIPLPSADEETFQKKNRNLPRRLFLDSPSNEFGDKDKVAHFFGAAFVSYSMKSVELTIYIGYLVEVIESVLMVDPIDVRDLMTNALGACFGKVLREHKPVQPSQMFLIPIISNFRMIL
jgi:hypothetical protein